MLYKTENGQTIDLNDNQTSIAERYNLKPAEDEIETLREQAKELGIKGYHSMKKETLIKRIAEI